MVLYKRTRFWEGEKTGAPGEKPLKHRTDKRGDSTHVKSHTSNGLSFLYVCMVNTIYLLSFVETPRKFIIAELSIRKLGSSSAL